jgi:diguanylate cyclase (GGDEF)-like protein
LNERVALVTDSDAARTALADALLAHEDDAFVVLRAVRDRDGRVEDFVHVLVNAAAERNAGQPLVGRRQLEVYPVTSGSMFEPLRDLMAAGGALRSEVRFPAGDPASARRIYQVYARAVGTDWVVCQYRDVTELRAAQGALQQQAWQDPLTGLPNRRLLLDHLAHALARLPRREAVVVLLFCDLDAFKQVNDSLGHPAGDELLQQVAQRMSSVVRPEDTVARFGGDEFVVVCEGTVRDVDPLAMAERLRGAVVGSYDVRGRSVAIGMSVGVALTERLVPVEELLADADAALYRAKRTPERPIAGPDDPPG